jgi:hypothetical protein
MKEESHSIVIDRSWQAAFAGIHGYISAIKIAQSIKGDM